ncbi:MAG: AAA family ATPase [Candidatus Hydrogenedentes bacterium]|nr:AAA family ATPase [Candidatus Hydrogenedentota bacterium]
MSQLTQLEILNYKRIRALSLEMRPLMILIGANGVGKTSLMEALELLSRSAQGKLADTLNEFGGPDSVVTRVEPKGEIAFGIQSAMPDNAKWRYDLAIQPGRGGGYAIAREELSHCDGKSGVVTPHIQARFDDIHYLNAEMDAMIQPNWTSGTHETSLAQVPRQFRMADEFRDYLASSLRYHTLDIGTRAPIRIPQKLRPAPLPGANGEDLVSYLHFLREEYPHNYESFLDTLHVAFKSFDSLGYPSVAAGMFVLTWRDSTLSAPLYQGELSEGLLRFIWLVALLHSPYLPNITMIDEPEVSIHPDVLNLLVDLFREAAQRTQLVVATHSDRLLRYLSPTEIVAMDLGEDGFAEAVWADSLDVNIWLEKHGLDEIWRMGQLGARA